jgi:DNA-binding NarL/FixJ family response regulator
MMSVNAQESYVRRAFEAGVRGYLLKNAAEFDLSAAVKAVASGRPVLGCTVS